MVLAYGDKIAPENLQTLEPHTAWRYSEPKSKKAKKTIYMPRLHQPERSVWRGIAALLPATAGQHANSPEPRRFLAPGALEWVSALAHQGILDDDFNPGIRVCGVEYGPQQSTIAEIIDDELTLPIRLLREDNPAAGKAAADAVSDAEGIAFDVWKLAQNVAQAAGADPKDTANGDQAREDFFARLDGPYRQWLSGLNSQTDVMAARRMWRTTVSAAAKTVAEQVITGAPPAAWVGREVHGHLVNVAQAEAWFNSVLGRFATQSTISGEDISQ